MQLQPGLFEQENYRHQQQDLAWYLARILAAAVWPGSTSLASDHAVS